MVRNSKIDILFILPHLKSGGAERVVGFIFDKLDRNIFSPHLLVIGHKCDNNYQLVNSDTTYLNKERLRDAFFSLYHVINLKKPNIVFSSVGHINIYLAFISIFFSKIKFIAREANVYSVRKSFSKKSYIPKFVLNFLYNRLDLIIFQSNDMLSDFFKNFQISKSKVVLINNPITLENIDLCSKNNKKQLKKQLNFISVGSLEPRKGFHRVIELLSKCDIKYNLTIIGEGQLRNSLEKQVNKLNLKDLVTFAGHTSDISKYYRKADYLIQGSFVEGFPNVVLEALSFGIPCIAFNSPGGHREMIINDENGYLIENIESGITVIESLITKEWNRSCIRESVIKRYSPNKILAEFSSAFQNLIHD